MVTNTKSIQRILKQIPPFITILFIFLIISPSDLQTKQSPHNITSNKELRVAIGAMVSPKTTLFYYKNLLDFIGTRINRKVKLVQRKTYAEVNQLLKRNEIDLAFVCSGAYVIGKRDFGLEILVAPVVSGKMVYFSNIIVNKDSQINSFQELRGKSFAFSDPDSNTGCLVPTYELAKIGESPQSFFKKQIFSRSHDNSIKAVSVHIIDGAAVDQLIWDYTATTHPELTKNTKVIDQYGPFPIPPVVISPGVDPQIKMKLRSIFLTLNQDPKGKEILAHLHIDQFRPIDDRAYDSIRAMEEKIIPAQSQTTGVQIN